MKLPLWIIFPHESAEIVKMISEGEISRASGRELMEIIIVPRIECLKTLLSHGVPLKEIEKLVKERYDLSKTSGKIS